MFNYKKIAQLRKKKNWTQRDLCNKLGVGYSTIGMWESGKRIPQRDLLIKLAQLFEVPIEYFYDIERKDVNELPHYDEEISKKEVQSLITGYLNSLDWSDEKKEIIKKQIDSLLEDDR